MNKRRMSLLSLMALVLLVLALPGIVQAAEAVIRVGVSLHAPNMSVRIGNTSYGRFRSYPIRRHQVYMVGKQDRIIANRLARYTGVPARKLIQLRSYGYRWFEIGRWLQLPSPVVCAAMDQRSWSRFLRVEQQHAKHGAKRHKQHKAVTYYKGN